MDDNHKRVESGEGGDITVRPIEGLEELPEVLEAVPQNNDSWLLVLRWRGHDFSIRIGDDQLDSVAEFQNSFHSALLRKLRHDGVSGTKEITIDEQGLTLPPVVDDMWREYVAAIRQKGGRGEYRTEGQIEAQKELDTWIEKFPDRLAIESTRFDDPMRTLNREVETFVDRMVCDYVMPGHIIEYEVTSRTLEIVERLCPSRIAVGITKIINDSALYARRKYQIRPGKNHGQAGREIDEALTPEVQLLGYESRGDDMCIVTTQHGVIEVKEKIFKSFEKFNKVCREKLGVSYNRVYWPQWDPMVTAAKNRTLLEFKVGQDKVADFTDKPDKD